MVGRQRLIIMWWISTFVKPIPSHFSMTVLQLRSGGSLQNPAETAKTKEIWFPGGLPTINPKAIPKL
jgi:hypothetical protein